MIQKMFVLTQRPRGWVISWNGGFFQVHLDFKTLPFSTAIVLPYHTWKVLALQFLKVAHERTRKKGKVLLRVGVAGAVYFTKDTQLVAWGAAPEVETALRRRLRFSATDMRTGVWGQVQLNFGQHSITLPRKAFAEFESDVLRADELLNQLLSGSEGYRTERTARNRQRQRR